MSKSKDFSEDLAHVSAAVNNDVDTIVKLVREKDKREGEPKKEFVRASEKNDASSSSDEQATEAPVQKSPKLRTQKSRKVGTRNKRSLTEQIVLENVTTRLRRDTNELLTEATLRQKLKKEEPATRQDIIEAALQDWFRRHGYSLTSHSSE